MRNGLQRGGATQQPRPARRGELDRRAERDGGGAFAGHAIGPNALLTAVLDKYRTQIQVELEKLEANVKAVMVRAEAYKANADISTVAGKLQLDKYQLDIQQNLGVFNGSITSLHNSITRSLNAATAYANTTSGLIQATTNNVLGVYNEKSQ